jgi:hypothetical protein
LTTRRLGKNQVGRKRQHGEQAKLNQSLVCGFHAISPCLADLPEWQACALAAFLASAVLNAVKAR